MRHIRTISKSEYIRMNMIAVSDMPTTDERRALENCMITCPVCGDDVRFMAMVFYDDNPSDCLCYECANTIAIQRRASAPI